MKQDVLLEETSVESLRSWLIDLLAREMQIDPAKIDTSRAFVRYGMDSMKAMAMVGDIEARLGLRLPPTLAWDYPDIDALSAHLAARMSAPASQFAVEESAKTSAASIESLLASLDALGDQGVDSVLNEFSNKMP